MTHRSLVSFFFFFNDTATTEIYTLSLHDALPISGCGNQRSWFAVRSGHRRPRGHFPQGACVALAMDRDRHDFRRNLDRKSTRLNSSHSQISYAVFCLKKKKKLHTLTHTTHDY